ncbi:MAG: hypothetical protein Q8R70_05775 [Methanoregula sp.]|nr:hypothetical protein [Methanoregula sp.]
MRSSWPYLFTILALIAMSVCSACVSQPQENKTPVQNISPSVNIGLRQITDAPVPSSVSLERARQMLGEIEQPVDTVNSSRQEIYYVLGKNLDSAGNAESWLFGTRSPEGNRLDVYARSRWTTIPWTATLPSEEIRFNGILLPEDLINQSREQIAGTAGPDRIREIELKNGIYSLTLTQGSTDRVLAFNATTGALIA